MPKTKKKPPPTQPGAVHRYVEDYYNIIPDGGPLQFGHLFYLFIQNGRLVTPTLQAVIDKLKAGKSKDCVVNITRHQIVTATEKQLKHFRQLRNEKEIADFQRLCSEEFTSFKITETPVPSCHSPEMEVDCDVSFPSPSAEPIVEHATVASAKPSLAGPSGECYTPNRPIRAEANRPSREQLTPRKLKMKKRLVYISKERQKEKEDHLQKQRRLRKLINVQKVHKIKRLNQSISRKEGRITTMAKQLESRQDRIEMKMLKKQFSDLQHNHDRLLKARSQKRQSRKEEMHHHHTNCVPIDEHTSIIQDIEDMKTTVVFLENQLSMKEEQETIPAEEKGADYGKKDMKTYNINMRMTVYDSIINEVPTQHIKPLLESYGRRWGMTYTVPGRTAIEQMARELGVMSDLFTAELAMTTANLTIGFDATTQNGDLLNCIHVTSPDECKIIDVDILPGGSAQDYSDHICGSINMLAATYADFHKDQEDFTTCHKQIIGNISNTMSDRAAVNHAAIRRIQEEWEKHLNELKCNLHPLDTIASASRSSLKKLETQKGMLFGKDCIAANIVLAMNKMRYRDGKGDPRGFKAFLHNKEMPLTILPRYRGNRLHIIFHTCGILMAHHSVFLQFLEKGVVSCGGLQSSIHKDFDSEMGKLEMQALGLVGKMLSGPWMQKFYTSHTSQIPHLQAIEEVNKVSASLEACFDNPTSVLYRHQDFFGQDLNRDDTVLQALRKCPASHDSQVLLSSLLEACFRAVASVLERQFQDYRKMEMTPELLRETESARSHNMDAEEVIGMLSAFAQKSPHATPCFLSSKIRAKKNHVVEQLDKLEEAKREKVVNWAIGYAQKRRKQNRKKAYELKLEVAKRLAQKSQQKEDKFRRVAENKLKNITSREEVKDSFPELDSRNADDVWVLLSGQGHGREISHVWYDEVTRNNVVYEGKIRKLKKSNSKIYVVTYWTEQGADPEDYEISRVALAADLMDGNLLM